MQIKYHPNPEEYLLQILPHGSGIDLDWSIEETPKDYNCYNSFHCMNEHGFYDGWIDFAVIINKESNNFNLHFSTNSAGWYRIYKYMLREYLEDLFGYSLRSD